MTSNDKFNGTAYLEWKPIKQLTFRTNNSVEYAYTNSRQFSPSFINKTSFGAIAEYGRCAISSVDYL